MPEVPVGESDIQEWDGVGEDPSGISEDENSLVCPEWLMPQASYAALEVDFQNEYTDFIVRAISAEHPEITEGNVTVAKVEECMQAGRLAHDDVIAFFKGEVAIDDTLTVDHSNAAADFAEENIDWQVRITAALAE